MPKSLCEFVAYSLISILHLHLVTAVPQIRQRFATEPSAQQAVLGSTAVFPCRVIDRIGMVQWTRDGFGLGTIRRLKGFERYTMIGSDEEGDFSLRISPVTLEDDANYQCQVSSAGGPKLRSKIARLRVFVPPQNPIITPGPEVTATQGVEISLKCLSIGGKPAPEIEWLDETAGIEMKNGVNYSETLLEDNKRVRAESILTFTPTRYHHGRTITCLTFNPALNEPLPARVKLRVEFPPEIDLVIKPTELIEGNEAKVSCRTKANPSVVSYRWFRNGKEVSDGREESLNLSVLTKADHGTQIACEATNAVGTIRRTQPLNIKYTPRFDLTPESESADPGSNVTLRCKVDGNPEPEITWHHVKTSTIVGSGQELKLKANVETAGTYLCVALSRGFSPLEGEVHLRLRGPPMISGTPSVSARKGKPSELRCEATAVPHPLAVTWTKEGAPINPEVDSRLVISEKHRADGVVSILTINETSEQDFAAYNCSVVNEYGVDVHQIILHRKPVIPFLLIVGVGGGVILVVVVGILIILCGKKLKLPEKDPPATVKTDQNKVERGCFRNDGMKPVLIKSEGTILPNIHNTLNQSSEIRQSDNDSDVKEPDNRTGSSLSAVDRDSDQWEGSEKGGRLQHQMAHPRYGSSTVYSNADQAYLSYVDYGRDYSPVHVGEGGYAQFKMGAPYARSSPASDPPSSLPSSVAPPPYTAIPIGHTPGVNGSINGLSRTHAPNGRLSNGSTLNVNGSHKATAIVGSSTVPSQSILPSISTMNTSMGLSLGSPLRHDLIADLQQPDLTREVQPGAQLHGRHEMHLKDPHLNDATTMHKKFILPPQTNMKPGTLV